MITLSPSDSEHGIQSPRVSLDVVTPDKSWFGFVSFGCGERKEDVTEAKNDDDLREGTFQRDSRDVRYVLRIVQNDRYKKAEAKKIWRKYEARDPSTDEVLQLDIERQSQCMFQFGDSSA